MFKFGIIGFWIGRLCSKRTAITATCSAASMTRPVKNVFTFFFFFSCNKELFCECTFFIIYVCLSKVEVLLYVYVYVISFGILAEIEIVPDSLPSLCEWAIECPLLHWMAVESIWRLFEGCHVSARWKFMVLVHASMYTCLWWSSHICYRLTDTLPIAYDIRRFWYKHGIYEMSFTISVVRWDQFPERSSDAAT